METWSCTRWDLLPFHSMAVSPGFWFLVGAKQQGNRLNCLWKGSLANRQSKASILDHSAIGLYFYIPVIRWPPQRAHWGTGFWRLTLNCVEITIRCLISWLRAGILCDHCKWAQLHPCSAEDDWAFTTGCWDDEAPGADKQGWCGISGYRSSSCFCWGCSRGVRILEPGG